MSKWKPLFRGIRDAHLARTHSIGIRQALSPSDVPYPLDQLRWLPIPVPAKSSGIVGVYFLWKGPRLMYVGQSTNVGKRMYDHKGRGHTLATCMRVEPRELLRQERLYISQYQPAHNIEGKSIG